MFLIANRWYVVLTEDEVPLHGTLGVKRLGHEVVFWRGQGGEVCAALDICPHRRAKLSLGRVTDGNLECPFHGFQFDHSGDCTVIPAHPDQPISGAMSLCTLSVRVEHGFVWIWTGPDPTPAEPVPFFDFTGYSWAGSAFSSKVDAHYSRAIENQLDFAHLSFVHRTTIGRFITEDIALACEVGGDQIKAHLGDGTSQIQFIGPNIWRSNTRGMWQFLAFVPVDEETTCYYVRTYQRMVRVPGVDWMLGKVNVVLNSLILREDTRVVETQPASETRLRMGEVLVPSDAAIISYRRWREKRRFLFSPGRRLRVIPSTVDTYESMG